jgi:hypothetical protein
MKGILNIYWSFYKEKLGNNKKYVGLKERL